MFPEEHLLLAVPRHFASTRKTASYQISTEMIRNGSFLNDSFKPVPLKFFEQDSFIMLKPDNDTRKRAASLLQQVEINPTILFELDHQLTSYNVTCTITTCSLSASLFQGNSQHT